MAIKAFSLFGEIELRDAKLKSGMQSATQQFAQFETKAKGHLKNIESSFAKFGSNFSQGFLSSFNIQSGSGIGSLLGSGAGNLLQSGVKALYGHVTDTMEKGMEFADKVQKWKFAFTSILGDETKGIEHLRELLTFGKDTAFKTEDVVDAAQQLEAVGMKAKEAIPSVLALGDALAKSGKFDSEHFNETILAITEMLSKNEISTRQMLLMLSRNIPNPYGLAARGMNRLGYRDSGGKEFTSEEVMKMGEGNQLNAQAFVRVLLNQMEFESKGMLDKLVSSTISGSKEQRDDTLLFLAARAMLGQAGPGGDLLARLEER